MVSSNWPVGSPSARDKPLTIFQEQEETQEIWAVNVSNPSVLHSQVLFICDPVPQPGVESQLSAS